MASFYIDPSALVNGTGTAASPFNTWASATITGGNKYYQKRGTVWNSMISLAGIAGTRANPLVIGAYANTDGTDNTGLPKPKIVVTGTANNCFEQYYASWQTIQDFDLTVYNTTGSGSAIEGFQGNAGNGRGLKYRRLDIHGTRGTSGGGIVQFTLVINDANIKIAEVEVEDCTFTDIGSMGTSFYGDVDGVFIRRCTYDGCGQTFDGHGATSFAHRSSFAPSDMTLSTTTYSKTLDATAVGYGGTFIPYRVVNNEGPVFDAVSAGATSTPSAGQFGYTGGVLYVNFGQVVDPGFAITVFFTEAKNIFYEDCTFRNTRKIIIEGSGVQADDGSQIVCRRCTSYNNQGSGYFLNTGLNSRLEACLAYNNGDDGVTMSRASGSKVLNSTIVGNLGKGINHSFGTTSTEISNNIIKGHSVGLDAPVGATAQNNNFYANTVASQSGVVPTGSTTTDPMLGVSFRPHPLSPVFGAGKHFAYRQDRDRISFFNPPAQGCYEKPLVKSSK